MSPFFSAVRRPKDRSDFNGLKPEAAISVPANGRVWLVLEDNKLKITATKHAETPLARGLTPLMEIDLSEGAYNPEYKTKRDKFVDVFFGSLLNWDFVNDNLAKATASPTVRAQAPAQQLRGAA